MINSFKCKETQKIFEGILSKKFPAIIHKRAYTKLALLNAAQTLNDLKIPPSNSLEALKGNRLGQYSIRINDQYRLCFIFKDHSAYQVEVVDYHK